MSESFLTHNSQPSDDPQSSIPDAAEAHEALSAEDRISELNSQVDEMRSALQRVQADFVNYKRRADQEREEMVRRSNAGLITRLIPVLDDLGMALDHAPASPDDKAWAEGVGLINRKLHTILESEGTTVIEADGGEFDPSRHEALGFAESATHQEGQVVSVVRPGYSLNGRVLRPAQVIVARNLAPPP